MPQSRTHITLIKNTSTLSRTYIKTTKNTYRFDREHISPQSTTHIASINNTYCFNQQHILLQSTTHITMIKNTSTRSRTLIASIKNTSQQFSLPSCLCIKFDKPKASCFKRRIWLYERGDFQEYRTQLASVDWDFINNDNSDCVADEIANVMIKTATRTIPNKIATIRPHDIPWTTIVFANSLTNLTSHTN